MSVTLHPPSYNGERMLWCAVCYCHSLCFFVSMSDHYMWYFHSVIILCSGVFLTVGYVTYECLNLLLYCYCLLPLMVWHIWQVLRGLQVWGQCSCLYALCIYFRILSFLYCDKVFPAFQNILVREDFNFCLHPNIRRIKPFKVLNNRKIFKGSQVFTMTT